MLICIYKNKEIFMKKSFLIGMFLILILFGAQAAATADLTITATAPQVLSVSLGSDVSFTLDAAGATVSLDNLTVSSNLKSWVLRIWSVNGSKLKNTDTTPEEIIYTVDLVAATPVAGITTGTLQSSRPSSGTGYIAVTDKTPKAGVSLPLSITYSGEGTTTFWSYDKGNFTDTINVEVAVN
jgi:hypothetical protein